MQIKFLLLGALGSMLVASAALAVPAGLGAYANITPVSKLQRINMPAVDVTAISSARAKNGKPAPFQFALPINVFITPAAEGQWETLADGRLLWRTVIYSENASSLNFGFNRYFMPAGGELYIYGIHGEDIRGPYTDAQNNGSGQLWTPVVPGHEAVIEVDLPARARDHLVLELTRVNHGFIEFWKAGTADKSGSCNVDVACPQADAWRNEIRSVARYTISGSFLCSGQLINNTQQDFTPYFLTANHCLSTAAQAAATVYYWNYQASSCGGARDGSLNQTQSGASLSATSSVSDFTLLKLTQKPDTAFKVYYAGWDNRDLEPSGATCIHHPAGDEKRISMSNHPTHATSYGTSFGAGGSNDQSHLQVEKWDVGSTEGGSSGSGLWNNEHRLVGQLHGGNASCDAPNESDWFGRFAVSWDSGGSAFNSLKPSLDPLNSGVQTLDGADPAMPGARASNSSSPSPNPGTASPATDNNRFGGALPLLTLMGLTALTCLRRRRY